MSEDREARRPEESPSPTDDKEPELRGTLLLTTVLLIMIFGFWAMMYLTLINR